jgi:hypothetical protein
VPTFWSPQAKKEKYRRRNADRRNAYSAVPYGHGRASNVRRTTVGVPPRFSPPRSLSSQGTQPQAMLPGTRPLRLTGFPRPCLSQSSECTSRPGRSAEGLMPKAARERVATPRAGTALARTAWNACRAASDWARFDWCHVTEIGTCVNAAVTSRFRHSRHESRHPEVRALRASKDCGSVWRATSPGCRHAKACECNGGAPTGTELIRPSRSQDKFGHASLPLRMPTSNLL